MLTGTDFLREMRADETPQVDALLRLAFEGTDEARLVQALRKSRDMAGEQVMSRDGDVIAYCALSRMVGPKGWLCLAPVTVHPDFQGRKIGKRMVGMLSEWARISGVYIVVLGAVPFYQSAGFNAARAARLCSPYSIEHTLLAGPGDDVPDQQLIYPRPFDDL